MNRGRLITLNFRSGNVNTKNGMDRNQRYMYEASKELIDDLPELKIGKSEK